MPLFPSQDLYDKQICTSYQQLLQVYSGSLVLDGSGSQKQYLDVTASYALNCNSVCTFDGSSVTQSFSASIWTFNHNLNQKYVAIQTYNDSDNQVIPQIINLFDENTAIISFGEIVSGTAIATIGANVTSSYYLLQTGSTYPITSSWSVYSTTSSYALNAGTTITTGSTYPITSSWALNCITSSYVLSSNVYYPIKTISTDYNVSLSDYTVLCNVTSSNINLKLPSASSSVNRIFNIKKRDATGYVIHVTTTNGDYIDFDITQSISHRGTNLSVHSDGSQYWIL
jgi:hypothetical protein